MNRTKQIIFNSTKCVYMALVNNQALLVWGGRGAPFWCAGVHVSRDFLNRVSVIGS